MVNEETTKGSNSRMYIVEIDGKIMMLLLLDFRVAMSSTLCCTKDI